MDHEDEDRRQCSGRSRREPGADDAQPGTTVCDARLREQRAADGQVLVDGEHQQRQRAGTEGQDHGHQQHDGDEQTVSHTCQLSHARTTSRTSCNGLGQRGLDTDSGGYGSQALLLQNLGTPKSERPCLSDRKCCHQFCRYC